ncbi:MAG TPA: maleylpyruvate isomerase family mycothiol-dependent enzyme [Pseudonocardia sp.]
MGNLPGVPTLTEDRYSAALPAQTGQLAALLDAATDADLGRQVPSCPDWNLRELAEHVGRGHRFAQDVVRRRVSGPAELAAPGTHPTPDDPAGLGGWLTEGAGALRTAVRAAGADPVWNFTGVPGTGGFWLRRMVHETAVHRADAALTVGAPFTLDADLAADAITEWLELVTSPGARSRGGRPDLVETMRGDGQRLHLHSTDDGLGEAGEWLIRRGPDGASWEHGHEKGDVAVRGTATDLLLVLVGRIGPDDERLQVFGDAALLEHWVRHVYF